MQGQRRDCTVRKRSALAVLTPGCAHAAEGLGLSRAPGIRIFGFGGWAFRHVKTSPPGAGTTALKFRSSHDNVPVWLGNPLAKAQLELQAASAKADDLWDPAVCRAEI